MHAPIVFRYVSFTFFSICCLAIVALAGSSLSQTKSIGSSSSIARADVFLIVNAIVGLLAVLVVVPMERIQRSAFTNRIWVEVCWVATLCILNFSAATAITAIGVQEVCSTAWLVTLPTGACGTVGALEAFSWLAACALLFHTIFLVVCTRTHAARVPNIWHKAITDVEWSSSGSQTKVASPVLPAYHEKQIPVYTVGVKPLIMSEKRVQVVLPTVEKVPVQHNGHAAQLTPPSVQNTPASQHATPLLYPQFLTSTQARAAVQQPSPADRSAGIVSTSDASSPQSGRSSPASATSSSASSPVSSTSLSDVETNADGSSASRPSSPRTKRRPPPLNLTGLSAFNSTNKLKRQDRS